MIKSIHGKYPWKNSSIVSARSLRRNTAASPAIPASGRKLQCTVAGPASRSVTRPEVIIETLHPSTKATSSGRRTAIQVLANYAPQRTIQAFIGPLLDAHIAVQAPVFDVGDAGSGREARNWAERLQFQKVAVCEGFKGAPQVGVERCGADRLVALYEEFAVESVRSPGRGVVGPELLRDSIRRILPQDKVFAKERPAGIAEIAECPHHQRIHRRQPLGMRTPGGKAVDSAAALRHHRERPRRKFVRAGVRVAQRMRDLDTSPIRHP